MVAKPSAPMRRWKYCLDALPLVDHFLLAFFEERRAPLPPELEKKVRILGTDRRLRNKFQELLQRSPGLVTCQGVLLEVDWWFEASVGDKSLVRHFRTFLQKQIRLLNIEERLVPWGQLETEELEIFGPVDATLIALLRGEQERTLKLVTGDEKLRQQCFKQRLSCIHVCELLNEDPM